LALNQRSSGGPEEPWTWCPQELLLWALFWGWKKNNFKYFKTAKKKVGKKVGGGFSEKGHVLPGIVLS